MGAAFKHVGHVCEHSSARARASSGLGFGWARGTAAPIQLQAHFM